MPDPTGPEADRDVDPDFDAVLAFLRETHGVDFSGYKRASLRRLVSRRRSGAGAADLRSYLDLLEANPAEVRALFDGLLINVTGFFRDDAPWQLLRDTLLPQLLAELGPDEPVRVWSAACATGEEAYSLAVVLHQLLGDDAYRRRVKVYATDVDEAALAVARTARYPASAFEAVAPQVVAEYFVPESGWLVFRPDLRPNVIFGRHDLLADAPISRVALLSCRNALMYFTPETQARVLERFAFALHGQGLLLLGKAEMLLTHGDLFTPVSLPHRIFRVNRRSPVLRYPGRRTVTEAQQSAKESAQRRVAEAAFVAGPDAQVVLDRDQRVVLVNETASARLGVHRDDVGRPFEQLELSYRPVELRSVTERVLAGGGPEELRDVHWERRDRPDTWWDVQVSALPAQDDEPLGVQITFVDVTRYHELTQDLTRAHAELQEAYEELQSSSEELETTNEELQSAIEELETTNEELQSTNEELETMNEELQSTNEELQTVNDELRDRTAEVGQANTLLEGILAGLQTGVAVLDRDLRVLLWNPRAERMWGLRTFEVEGVHLRRLPGGLPVEVMQGLADRVLAGAAEQTGAEVRAEVALTNRFGHPVSCTLSATPLHDHRAEIRGVVVAMDERPADQDGAGDATGATG